MLAPQLFPGNDLVLAPMNRDFLHTSAATPLTQHFSAAGAACSLSTNCDLVLRAAHESFPPLLGPSSHPDFSLRFWVDDDAASGEPPWQKPYVRGLGRLVFAGFDAQSSMLADLRARRVIGRFSAGMARDSRYWKMVVFPMLMSILSGSLGLVELHASCIAKDHQCLLLLGPSCSGKSTLAMAFTEAGFRFVADDRTFCSAKTGLQAYGLPKPLKLRREAAPWFEDFRDREPIDVQNGESVFYFDPNRNSGPGTLAACKPVALIFLERQQAPSFRMTLIGQSEARSHIEKDLLADDPAAAEKQAEIVDQLLTLPRLRLKYGGTPQAVARQIGEELASRLLVSFSGGTA